MNQEQRYSADEFERESRYIENLIWDAIVIEAEQRVLFCGYGERAKWIKRAMEAGADVTVIEHREEVIRDFAPVGAKLLRGSTSVIPAKPASFDLAVAFHYLHETDPFFHAQILSELSRVATRVAIVEPGPPADALGKHIARLYSQAKRELGQFEYYQPLEYWKKLLRSVKADVATHIFAFAKIPPREYLKDTIELLLATMEVEDAPRSSLDELRAIARHSDTLLLPPPRFVLIGAAVGELPQPIFTPREEPTPTPPLAKAAQVREPVPQPPGPVTAAAGYEFPPVEPPAPPSWPAAEPSPAPQQPAAFNFAGLPPEPAQNEPPAVPFGAPFAMPQAEMPFGVPPMPGPPAGGAGTGGMGWHWEPPENEAPEG